jgi:hypothetical protein
MVAGAASAVDFSAIVHLDGSLLNVDQAAYDEYGTGKTTFTDGNKVTAGTVNGTTQKDADAIQFTVNGEKAGAAFNFFYNAGADNAVSARSAKIWLKPIDAVKVSVGQVGDGFYKEQIHWWKDPVGDTWANVNAHNYSGYSSRASVDGWGALVETTPIAGLNLNAGFVPGANNALFTKNADDSTTYNEWGAGAKYQINDMLSAGVSYSDEGKTKAKLLKIGTDVKAGGFYGMVNGVLRFEDYTNKEGTKVESGFSAVVIDNYFKYSAGAFTAQLRVPFVLRMTDVKDDDSYFIYDAKFTYGAGSFTPYLEISSDDLERGKINLNKMSDSFCMEVYPGVTFNVGECALDLGMKVQYLQATEAYDKNGVATTKHPINISVPFTVSVNF